MLKALIPYLKARLSKEDGMEVLQVLLIAGLVLVIILVVFYPAVESFFNDMMSTITTWWTNKGSAPFERDVSAGS